MPVNAGKPMRVQPGPQNRRHDAARIPSTPAARLLAGGLLAVLLPLAAAAQEMAGAPPATVAESPDSLGTTWGTPGEDALYALLRLPEGGYAAAGSLALEIDASPAWWQRFDGHGLPELGRIYAPDDRSAFYGLAPLRNGDMLAYGDAAGGEEAHAAAHRLSPAGAARWTHLAADIPGYTYGMAAVELPGGDIVLAVEGSDEADTPFVLLLRLDGENGTRVWESQVAEVEDVAGLVLQPDGRLLLVGNAATEQGNEIRLVAVAEDGTPSVHATVATRDWVTAYRSLGLPDGDLALAVYLSEGAEAPGGVLRAGSDGQVRWLSPIGTGGGLVEALAVVPDGKGGMAGLAVAGALREPGEDGDAFAGLLSAEGEWRWARRFAGPRDSQLNAIAVLPDGSLVAAGTVIEPAADAVPPAPDGDGEEQAASEPPRDQNAWLLSLSAEGEPRAAAEEISDPLLRAVAEDMRLATGQLFSGTSPGGLAFTSLAPPAFRQEGAELVMATAPMVAGPIMVNVSQTRFRAEDGVAAAATVLAQPLLQVTADDGEAVVEVDRQKIAWRYRPGTFLAERSEVLLEGIRMFGPEQLRFEIAALDSASEARPQTDGSWDVQSRVELRDMSGGTGGDPLTAAEGEAWVRMAGDRFTFASVLNGLDTGRYAAAIRDGAATGTAVQMQDHARAFRGELAATGLTYQGSEGGNSQGLKLDRVTIDMAMERADLAAPMDARVTYGLEGLEASEGEDISARLGRAQLTLTATGFDLAALQELFAEAGTAEAMAEAERPDQAPGEDGDLPGAEEEAGADPFDPLVDRFLAAIGGGGLEIAGSDADFNLGDIRAGFSSLQFGLNVAGVKENSGNVLLRLSAAGVRAEPTPEDVDPTLLPRDLELDISLGPLPMRDVAAAVIAGDDDSLPFLMAEAGPMLQIPRLALVAAAGEIHGDGSFAFDPSSPTMLTGRMTLLVVQFDELRKRLIAAAPEEERPLVGGGFGYLEGLAAAARMPDGRAASRFELEAQPDGSLTVNGRPFPPEEQDAGGAQEEMTPQEGQSVQPLEGGPRR